MGFWKGISNIFKAGGEQVIRTQNFWRYESDKRYIRFGQKFDSSAKEYGVSEKDALDVYYTGLVVNDNRIIKKYNGYEIGILYNVNSRTGQIQINFTWKKDRL